jgi:hypothetical protein
LKVFIKVKESELGDLANAVAKATPNISTIPDTQSDLARMPALWLWHLLNLRKEVSLVTAGVRLYVLYCEPRVSKSVSWTPIFVI